VTGCGALPFSLVQPNKASDILEDVNENDVVKTFITIRKRRPEK
jgi:hypothetical protein